LGVAPQFAYGAAHTCGGTTASDIPWADLEGGLGPADTVVVIAAHAVVEEGERKVHA
jgi:hypothetical protein